MKMKKITKLVLSLLMMLTCINLVNVHAEGNDDNESSIEAVDSNETIDYTVEVGSTITIDGSSHWRDVENIVGFLRMIVSLQYLQILVKINLLQQLMD